MVEWLRGLEDSDDNFQSKRHFGRLEDIILHLSLLIFFFYIFSILKRWGLGSFPIFVFQICDVHSAHFDTLTYGC